MLDGGGRHQDCWDAALTRNQEITQELFLEHALENRALVLRMTANLHSRNPGVQLQVTALSPGPAWTLLGGKSEGL